MGHWMSSPPRQLQSKQDVALRLLEESSMFIHLDPRRPEVVVPKWFMGQPQLVLQVGLNMAIPIPDLKLDEKGITCTLSFNRAPFWCKIPWTAIYALVGEDGRGGVWPDDVPPEIQLQRQGAQPQQPASRSPGSKRPRPRLAAVPPESARREEAPDEGAQREDEREPEPKKPTPIRRGPVAVPPPEAEAPPPETEASAEAEEPPPEPTKPTSGGKKPKREIPPYLRVIK
jgi:hypothetical protein